MEKRVNQSSEVLRNQALNETVSKGVNPKDLENFLEKVYVSFVNKRINEFPRICVETRRVNVAKRKIFDAMQNSGGWSDKKTFKWDFEIPRELYSFMTNLVYRDFWKETEEKNWRPFMIAIMKGADPESLLVKTKMIYGSNKDHSLIM